MTVLVDFTHVHRKMTGIERISLELFSKEALAPLTIRHVTAKSVAGMMGGQWITLPAMAAWDRSAVVLCPGFPPSLPLQAVSSKIIPYVHDLFLLTHVETLSRNAKLYMRPSFLSMLKTQSTFLTNSDTTKRALEKVARPRSRIVLYRPVIRDVFALAHHPRPARANVAFTFVAMGTVEPRKNYRYAVQIVEALNARGFACRLRIIGRNGWGADAQALGSKPHVEMLGHLADEQVRRTVAEADCLICTSLDEGLGLPMVELQYAGLASVCVDIPVFRELLGERATFIPRADAAEAASRIAAMASTIGWRQRATALSREILETYNSSARRDRDNVIGLVRELEGAPPRHDAALHGAGVVS